MAAAFPDLRFRESVTLHIPTPIPVEDKAWQLDLSTPSQVEDKRGGCASRPPIQGKRPTPHSG